MSRDLDHHDVPTQGRPAYNSPGGSTHQLNLSASVMCAQMDELGLEIERLEAAGVDSFHFDVMDGHFVPNLGLSSDDVAAARLHSRLPFHVHAMVADPGAFVDVMADAGCDLYAFHVEAERYPRRMVDTVHARGMKCGLAINPGTPLDYLADGHGAEQVLVMGVEPGYARQRFFETTPDRIGEIRRRIDPSVEIGLDGHVDAETSSAAMAQGASVFVCGTSALFRPGGYAANLGQLRDVLTMRSRARDGNEARS
jgi:ribulose-phosphate 3-epimerase